MKTIFVKILNINHLIEILSKRQHAEFGYMINNLLQCRCGIDYEDGKFNIEYYIDGKKEILTKEDLEKDDRLGRAIQQGNCYLEDDPF